MNDKFDQSASDLEKCINNLKDFLQIPNLKKHIIDTLINAITLIPNKSLIYSKLCIKFFEEKDNEGDFI